MTVSNDTQVTLRSVGFNLSGNFTCEVTTDAPFFFTAVATNILTVVGEWKFFYYYFSFIWKKVSYIYNIYIECS